MTDGHDELELLKQANPIPSSTATDDELAALAARIERITMDTQQDTRPTTIDAPVPTGPRQRRWAVALAGVAAALLALVGAVALVGDDGSDVESAAPPTTAEPAPTDPGMSSSLMCAEVYSLETLAARDLAFDGTLKSVDGDAMTFEVSEWFHGGDGDTATLEGAATIGSFTSIGDSIELEPGTRMLVAGDERFAWSCGFTQPHDATVADQWREVFSG